MALPLACVSSFPPLHPHSSSSPSIPPSAHARTPPSFTLSKPLVEIQNSGVIACLRAHDGKLAMEAACAALSGGITVLEIVMSTPGVLEVVKGLRKDFPLSVIGIGTVLNSKDARKAVRAGAQFLMSPGTVMDILLDAEGSGVLYIPGVMTPTEVICAFNAGAKIVKIYPSSVLGGDIYISTIKRLFSHIPMVASQGIKIDSIERYIKGGASAVVLSDAIFEKEAMRQKKFDKIQMLARLATLQASQAKQQ